MQRLFIFVMLAGLFITGAKALAGEGERAFYVDQTEGCFVGKQYPCALKSLQGNFRISRGEQVFVLEQGSSILLKSEKEIQLLEGEMWIEKSASLRVQVNPYLQAQVSGEFWIRKEDDRTVISNLEGEFKTLSKKVLAHETLPMGFENWYAGLRTDQKVDTGIIQPIGFEPFASSWIRMFSGSKAEKLSRLKAYRDKWKESVAQGADLYSKVIERSLASIENGKVRERKVIRSRKEERESLRMLFRQQNYLDPDSL